MATKDHCLSFNDKQGTFNGHSNNDSQYRNLNLNHNNHCLPQDIVISKSVVTNDRRKTALTKPSDFNGVNDLQKRNDSLSWNNSEHNLSSDCIKRSADKQKDFGYQGKASNKTNTNSSTLSLHITAYENSIENASESSNNKNDNNVNVDSIKKWKNGKELLSSFSNAVQTSYEFPRQQKDTNQSKPEVMQFKASQRLLNLNRAPPSNIEMTEAADVRTADVTSNKNFDQLLINEEIIPRIKKLNFRVPTPVQVGAIPLGMLGNDLLVQAKSGTGKTLVFAVFVANAVLQTSGSSEVAAVVIAPVREIALQIKDLIDKLTPRGTRTCLLIGGEDLRDNKVDIAKGCSVAIGTPGRIAQLVRNGCLSFKQSKLFVLDEADKLMESTFTDDIKIIYNSLNPKTTQVTAFSATYPNDLDDYLSGFMKSPINFRLDSEDVQLLGIQQYAVVTFNKNPIDVVVEFLEKLSYAQCVIFTNQSEKCVQICDALKSYDLNVAAISANFDQEERKKVVKDLKKYSLRIMVSTDLTARGIDATNVNLIFNMGVPSSLETYLHRIGRAGRYGGSGASLTILNSKQDVINFGRMAVSGNLNVKYLKLDENFPYDLPLNTKFHAECVGFVESCENIVTEAPTRLPRIHKEKKNLPAAQPSVNIVSGVQPSVSAASESGFVDQNLSDSQPSASIEKQNPSDAQPSANIISDAQCSSSISAASESVNQNLPGPQLSASAEKQNLPAVEPCANIVQQNLSDAQPSACAKKQNLPTSESAINSPAKGENRGRRFIKQNISSVEPSVSDEKQNLPDSPSSLNSGKQTSFDAQNSVTGSGGSTVNRRFVKPHPSDSQPSNNVVKQNLSDAQPSEAVPIQTRFVGSRPFKPVMMSENHSHSSSVADKMAVLKNKSFGKSMGSNNAKQNLFSPAVPDSKSSDAGKVEDEIAPQNLANEVEDLAKNVEKLTVENVVGGEESVISYSSNEMLVIRNSKTNEEWALYAKTDREWNTKSDPFQFDPELRVSYELQLRVLRKREENKLRERQEILGIRNRKKEEQAIQEEKEKIVLYPSAVMGITKPQTVLSFDDCEDLESCCEVITEYLKKFSSEKRLFGSVVFPRVPANLSNMVQFVEMMQELNAQQSAEFAQKLKEMSSPYSQEEKGIPPPSDETSEKVAVSDECADYRAMINHEEFNDEYGTFYAEYATKLLSNNLDA